MFQCVVFIMHKLRTKTAVGTILVLDRASKMPVKDDKTGELDYSADENYVSGLRQWVRYAFISGAFGPQ